MIFVKRDLFHASVYYELGRHFRWTVPVANLAILMLAGLLVAGVIRLRPGLISPRFGVFLFATLAIWGPMLRAPFYGVASLFVAIGSARLLSRWMSRHAAGFRRFAATAWRCSWCMVWVRPPRSRCAGRRWRKPGRSRGCRRRPERAGNVLLIVMDTVPRRKPGALRLQPRDHAAPVPMGQKGGAVRPGHGAGALDVPVALLVPDRPVALDAGRPLGADLEPGLSHARRIPRGPRLPDRRVRRQYSLVQLRVGPESRVRPLRGLSPDAHDGPGQHRCPADGCSRTCETPAIIPP